ncbi:hypothetical protein ISCGN_010131 [Ixodes scapularis]
MNGPVPTCGTLLSVWDSPGWMNDLVDAPAFGKEDVRSDFDRRSDISNRQLTRGWNFQEERNIRNVQWRPNDADTCFFRSTCVPSMKPGHYKQVVMMERTPPQVLHACCSCTAGLSETCQHVAGLMYAVAELKSPSCTDVRCEWVVPYKGHKRPAPMPMEEIAFWKVAEKKRKGTPKKRNSGSYTPAHGDAISELAAQLEAVDSKLVWLRYARPAKKENFLPLISDGEDLWSPESQAIYYRHLKAMRPLSTEEREGVQANTIGQATNEAWFRERVGKLTASNFKKAARCRKPEYIVREILYPKPNKDLPASDPREYGRRMEPQAIESYVLLRRYYDYDTRVTSTGLFVHAEYPFLAASPDGIVNEGGEQGLLEVKCPQSKENMTPEDACADSKFCSAMVGNVVTLKREHAYYYQIQGQLGVTGHSWCDFVIFTNAESLAKSISVERIYFDAKFWEGYLLPGLLYFYTRAVVPEILTRRVKRFNKLYSGDSRYLPYPEYLEAAQG